MHSQIHNPTFGTRTGGAERRSVPFPHPSDGDRLRVAFIDNEKPNTSRLLQLVADGLGARYSVEAIHVLKGGAAHPAPDDVIDQAASADLVVLGTAD